MLILGVHTGNQHVYDSGTDDLFDNHDTAALLLRDGELLMAVEEERLNRIKHSTFFPARSVRACLSAHGLTINDIDRIAFQKTQGLYDHYAIQGFLMDPSLRRMPTGRTFLSRFFEDEFGSDVTEKLRFCNHHLAHAWSAFVPSGYDRSLVLVLDGIGESESGGIYLAENNEMTLLRPIPRAHSLGLFYVAAIGLLGYRVFDEYKVMGLAPYGDPKVYKTFFDTCFELLPNGEHRFPPAEELLAGAVWFIPEARRKGDPFTQAHKDFAAGIQYVLETIAMHILQHFRKETGASNLCFAGGVAHNCTLNGKILYSGLFDRVYVQPAAHDAGSALGAALAVLHEECPSVRPKMPDHLFLGLDLGDDDDIERALAGWSDFVSFERSTEIEVQTARLLADGAVVGWVQGRSEFGPRALGHRSILADPRPPQNKERINRMVKKREGYRPFAPSVLEEHAAEFFVLPKTEADLSTMIYVLDVQERHRATLGAVTHVDGTARLQSVSKRNNQRYWSLIDEFRRITGVPILLNTSFNNNVEPIVDSVADAVACFLTTDIDRLVIGDFMVSKKTPAPGEEAYRRLRVAFPSGYKLIKRLKLDEHGVLQPTYALESETSDVFREVLLPLSEQTFLTLMHVDGETSVGELLSRQDPSNSDAGAVIRELVELWHKRGIVLQAAPDRGSC